MKNIIGLSESAFLVPEEVTVSEHIHQPSRLEPGEKTDCKVDHSTENESDGRTLELFPQTMRISPVFELASVGHGSAQELKFSGYDNSLADGKLKSNIDAALALIVTRLDEEESLIVTHKFKPDDSGCMEVSTSFHVEREMYSMPDRSQMKLTTEKMLNNWQGVFRTGLALLDDDYCFRQMDAKVDSVQRQRQFIRFDSCTISGQTGMGFTAGKYDETSTVTLPILASTKESKVWTEALEKTIKAARAQEAGTTIGIRISRFALTSEQRSRLGKLDVNTDPQGRHHSVALSKAIQFYLEHAGEFLQVAPFVEIAVDSGHPEKHAGWSSKCSSPLVDVFAKDVLPMHSGARPVGALGKQRSNPGNTITGSLDLTTVMPYSGSLPPTLAKPRVLRELDFARHHGNFAVRLPQDGLLLGTAQVGGLEQRVRLGQSDRSRHVYVVGGTGTGKSSLLFNMIKQDVLEGRGLALSDPGGDLFEQVLGCIPQHRIGDVVIIDPSDPTMAVGLNPLDFGDKPTPLAVNRVISDLLDIFDQLYDMKTCGGPRFEQFFRSVMLLASAAPYESPSNQTGCPSFLTILAILQDANFRKLVLSTIKGSFLGEDLGGEVVDFFAVAHATSGDSSFANFVPYISCKLTRFTSNPLMRSLLCSGARTIDYRNCMDTKKILLVNLSKGAIGSMDANMIGMLVTKGLFGAALSRFDVPRDQRVPFTYFIDEFQNVVTDVEAILAEGRKWGLQTVLAHQTLGQLRDRGSRGLLDAILGNVPTKLFLRTGIEEAAVLEQALLPEIDKLTLAQLPDRQVAARLLIDNKVSMPFVFRTTTVTDDRSPEEQARIAALARQSSRMKYGVNRAKPVKIVTVVAAPPLSKWRAVDLVS